MDEEKLINKIKENKEKQVKKYVDCVKKIVQRDPLYYKDKKYAEKFKE